MKKAILIVFLIFSLSFLSLNTAKAGPVIDRILKNKELRVGISGDQPPLHMKTKDGEIIGLDVDLAKIMADVMGVKLNIVNIPFPELLPALEAGKIDMIISGMTMTPQRNLKVAFVGPYYISGKSILAKSDRIALIQNSNDINKPDMTLAVLKNSTSQMFAEKFAPKAKLMRTQSLDESLNLLLKGEVDAVVSDHPFCMVSAFRYQHKGLASLKTPINFEPLGIAVPPDDPLFINWVENLLKTFQGSGELNNLTMHWFKDTSWLMRLPAIKESL